MLPEVIISLDPLQVAERLLNNENDTEHPFDILYDLHHWYWCSLVVLIALF